MHLIQRFLSGYTDNFLAAVALWPLASIALTLPILAFLYHRDGRLRLVSVTGTYLAVLYLLGIGCFTLWPLPDGSSGPGITYGIPWQLDPLAFIGDFLSEGVSTLPQILFNIVLFMPLGIIAGRLLRWSEKRSIVAGLAVSLVVEAAQGTGLFGLYPYAFRTADVDDLIYNTLGAALGWHAASALARVLPPGAPAEENAIVRAPGLIRRCVAFWLDMLLAGAVSLAAVAAGSLVLAAIPGAEALYDAPWMLAVAGAVFIWIEGVIPWRNTGSTPGGAFVRMSCEGRPREGTRRVAFYVARVATLGLACLFPLLLPLPLALFFLVFRKMPYDFV